MRVVVTKRPSLRGARAKETQANLPRANVRRREMSGQPTTSRVIG